MVYSNNWDDRNDYKDRRSNNKGNKDGDTTEKSYSFDNIKKSISDTQEFKIK